MTRAIDKLSALGIRNATPAERVRRLHDGAGLYLEITPAGGRYWRMKYRIGGREKRLALGVYPEVSLVDARRQRDAARAGLRQGDDPSATRRALKDRHRRDARGAFTAVAGEWLAQRKRGWAPATAKKAHYIFDHYLIPGLRRHSIADLSTADAVRVLTAIDQHAPELAARAKQYLGSLVDFAIQNGLREDGRVLSLKRTLGRQTKSHIPAATKVSDIGPLVRAIRSYPSPLTRAALELAMLTAMRPGIVAAAQWAHIHLDSAEWHVPGALMKMGHDHISPLPRQAIAVLQEIRELSAGSDYVFPAPAKQKTPHLHRDSLSNALRILGFQGKHATHGFRSMLRTIGRERLGFDADVLESQLGHAKRDEIQAAYDRTLFNDHRRDVMQQWADYLDDLALP